MFYFVTFSVHCTLVTCRRCFNKGKSKSLLFATDYVFGFPFDGSLDYNGPMDYCHRM